MQTVGTEFQYKLNGKEYYKVFVYGSDGKMVRGSRTVNSFTGSALARVLRDYQAAIRRGAWNGGAGGR